MRVREALPADASALQRLNEAFNGPGLSAAEQIARALRENSDELVSVAEEDGRVCGFICGRSLRSFCYPEGFAEITELYVAPEKRRRGVAGALLAHMEARLQALGARAVHLYTGENNRPARAFYAHAGYRSRRVIQCSKDPED